MVEGLKSVDIGLASFQRTLIKVKIGSAYLVSLKLDYDPLNLQLLCIINKVLLRERVFVSVYALLALDLLRFRVSLYLLP